MVRGKKTSTIPEPVTAPQAAANLQGILGPTAQAADKSRVYAAPAPLGRENLAPGHVNTISEKPASQGAEKPRKKSRREEVAQPAAPTSMSMPSPAPPVSTPSPMVPTAMPPGYATPQQNKADRKRPADGDATRLRDAPTEQS